jgi:phasin family protein
MPTDRNANTNEQISRAADTGRENFAAAAEGAQRFTEQVSQLFSLSAGRGEELTRQSAQNLEAITEASTALTRGFEEVSREWLGLVQEGVRRNMDAFGALSRCRSIPEFVSLQSELVRDNLQQTIEGLRRMGETSTRVANEATQSVTTRAGQSSRRRAA